MTATQGGANRNAFDFLTWLVEDIDSVTAEVGTPRDDQLKEFERKGFLRFKGTFCDTNDYEITNSGAFISSSSPDSKLEAYRKALEEIGRQKTTEEIEAEEEEYGEALGGDVDGAYDAIINIARKVLAGARP